MSVEKPDVEGPAGIESILLTGAESAQPQPDWDFGLFGGPSGQALLWGTGVADGRPTERPAGSALPPRPYARKIIFKNDFQKTNKRWVPPELFVLNIATPTKFRNATFGSTCRASACIILSWNLWHAVRR
jgi:hypothetical protein